MKKFLYTLAACIILPLSLVGGVIYCITFVLQLLCRIINTGLDEGMRWVDRNITPNL